VHSSQDLLGLPVLLNTRPSEYGTRGDEGSAEGDSWWNAWTSRHELQVNGSEVSEKLKIR